LKGGEKGPGRSVPEKRRRGKKERGVVGESWPPLPLQPLLEKMGGNWKEIRKRRKGGREKGTKDQITPFSFLTEREKGGKGKRKKKKERGGKASFHDQCRLSDLGEERSESGRKGGKKKKGENSSPFPI